MTLLHILHSLYWSTGAPSPRNLEKWIQNGNLWVKNGNILFVQYADDAHQCASMRIWCASADTCAWPTLVQIPPKEQPCPRNSKMRRLWWPPWQSISNQWSWSQIQVLQMPLQQQTEDPSFQGNLPPQSKHKCQAVCRFALWLHLQVEIWRCKTRGGHRGTRHQGWGRLSWEETEWRNHFILVRGVQIGNRPRNGWTRNGQKDWRSQHGGGNRRKLFRYNQVWKGQSFSPQRMLGAGWVKILNIARGTTDPGYWVHNSNHHIIHGKKNLRGEVKYISDYKNQAWSLKLEKSSVRTISLCPFLGDHLFHLVHLPIVLLIHHHLNDNHHLHNGPTTYIVANMITAPIFPATLAPPCRPPWWRHSSHWASPYQLTTPTPS